MLAGEIKTNGIKTIQREDKYSVNRQGNYSRWRYKVSAETGHRLYTTDLDFVEWSFNRREELVAGAVIDATQADEGVTVSDRYLESILERFRRQLQGRVLSFASKRFGCDGYIVLFREDCSGFWVYNWTRERGWKFMTEEGHLQWLVWIHEEAGKR